MTRSPSNLPQKSGLSIQFSYFLLALILSGCDGSGAGQDDAGADSGDAGDAGIDGSADADADSDTDGDADADADADAGDAAHPSDAGEDAYCPYDAAARVGWVKTWGGPGVDEGTAIAVGPDGTIVVAGTFHDTVDFDPGLGEDLHTATGQWSAFISKFTQDGEHIWTRTIGGDSEYARVFVGGLGVLSDGSVVMGGMFDETVDFDPGPGMENRTPTALHGFFMVKLTGSGEFVWAYTPPGAGDGASSECDLAVSQQDSIYLVGRFDGSIDFDPGPGIEVRTSSGSDAVVVKLDADGVLEWARILGSGFDDQGRGIAVGADGDVVATGSFRGTFYYERGQTGQIALGPNQGETDIFVVKLDTDGGLVWSRTVGGLSMEHGESVCVDDEGSVYVGGGFSDVVDFDPTDAGVDEHTWPPDSVFVSKYTADGGYEWTRTTGSSNYIFFRNLKCAQNGILYLGEFYGEMDFDPGPSTDVHITEGAYTFLIKYREDGEYTWGTAFGSKGSSGDTYPRAFIQEMNNDYLVLGRFGDTVDFDPTICTDIRTAQGDPPWDVFLWRCDENGNYWPQL